MIDNTVITSRNNNPVTELEIVISPRYDTINGKYTVIKRDGRKELFSLEKVLKVIRWSVVNGKNTKKESYPYYIETLLNDLVLHIKDGIRTQDLYDTLIDIAASKISALYPQWDDIAKYLYLLKIYKENFKLKRIGTYPSLKETFLSKGIEKGIYDPQIINAFSEDDLYELNNYIDPNRDTLFNYKGSRIFFDKYCKTYDDNTIEIKKKLELPQITYMAAAMHSHFNEPHNTSEEKKKRLKNVMYTYDLLSKHRVTFSTPRITFGLQKRAQFASCVLITADDDTLSLNVIDDWAALYSKFMGGIAIDWAYIRARGSKIFSNSGKSDGPIPFIRRMENTVSAFNQGGKRKGSVINYMQWWHMDILDFLVLKDAGGAEELRARKCKYAMKINRLLLDRVDKDEYITLFDPKETRDLVELYGDEFEKRYKELEEDGSKRSKRIKARELISEFFRVRVETGNVYLAFMDNINEQEMTGRFIGMSNLCIAEGQPVLTIDGYKPIETLKDKFVTIWNGDEWTEAFFEQTGAYKQVFDVILSNGSEIPATWYHKWPVITGRRNKKIVMKTTLELKKGDRIKKTNLLKPCEHGSLRLNLAYENGFFTADGTEFYQGNTRNIMIYIYDDSNGKNKCGESLRSFSSKKYYEKSKRKVYYYRNNSDIKYKFFVPSIEYTIDSRIEWLAGLFDGDATLLEQNDYNHSQTLQLASVQKYFINEVRRLLNELGVEAKVRMSRKEGFYNLPDSNKNSKKYFCNRCFRLLIPQNGLNKLYDLGITKHLKRLSIKPQYDLNFKENYIKVENITFHWKKENVYCCNEPKKHTFVVDGVLTSNCMEITVPSRPPRVVSEKYYKNEDGKYEVHTIKEGGEIGLCNLSSVNILEFYHMTDSEKDDLVSTLLRGMYNSIQTQYYPVAEGAWPNKAYRPIGIGVTDGANLLAFEGIKYTDDRSLQFVNDVMSDLYWRIYYHSMLLAKEVGTFEGFRSSNWAKGLTPFHLSRFRKENPLGLQFKDEEKWMKLGELIERNGVAFSLHAAIPPSACQSLNNTITIAKNKTMDLKYFLTHVLRISEKQLNEVMNSGIRGWLRSCHPVEIEIGDGLKDTVEYVFYNGNTAELYEITMDDGFKGKYTFNHKFKNSKGVWVETQFLKPGNLLSGPNGLKAVRSIKKVPSEPTWDIECKKHHYFLTGNGLYSHNTSGKVTNATESFEPIMDLFYVETGNHNYPTVVKGIGEVRNYYERCWDIPTSRILELAAVRQIYLDQAQSFNEYWTNADSVLELYKSLRYAERLGLKTIYYFKTPKSKEELICSSCSS